MSRPRWCCCVPNNLPRCAVLDSYAEINVSALVLWMVMALPMAQCEITDDVILSLDQGVYENLGDPNDG